MKALKWFLALCVIGVIWALFSGTSIDELKELTLDKARGDRLKDTKYEMIDDHLQTSNIESKYREPFYNCLSQFIHTKNPELHVKEVFGWCVSKFTPHSGFTEKYYNLDPVEDHLSKWDGSHYTVTNAIKKSMLDEESYQHISTRASYRLRGKDAPYLRVFTRFSGLNAYGVRIKHTVVARTNIKTGNILKIEWDN